MAGPAGTTRRGVRRLLTAGWLLRHALVLVLVVTFGALANWQYSRAIAGNALSWAYTLQWPMFGGLVVAMWIRVMRDELRADRREPAPTQPPITPRPRPSTRRAAAIAQPGGESREAEQRPEDRELVAYNRYLAWLNANPDRRPSEYPG